MMAMQLTNARAASFAGALVVGVALAGPAAGQAQSVVDSPHNLSVSGPGRIRAASEQEVCIFCHTPHRSSPVQPLWNREMPVNGYTVYTSSSLDARPGQPTGASKMCLSCHDGTIALGSIVSGDTIRMARGVTTLPPGPSNLGTDLSDDHPISFRYDSGLVARDQRLVDPHAIPPELSLDANREMQCTTCHDAHDNAFGHFLVMDPGDSQLCISCHRISETTIDAHEDCSACHRTHTAPSGPFLLVEETVTATCISCHDGSVAGADNILADLEKLSVHDTGSPVDVEGADGAHVTCSDCHDPHTMSSGGGRQGSMPPNLGLIGGVDDSGAALRTASAEHQVCFRCHSTRTKSTSNWISRQVTQVDTRLQFDPDAHSAHPVLGPGRAVESPSLKPRWRTATTITCGDCHGSNTSRKAGGSGPNGPHGSDYAPLLIGRYETRDFTPESSSSYELCYRCHERDGPDGILRDRTFPHSLHVIDANTPCSACHDAHGISSAQGRRVNHAHLINFDTSIVFSEPRSGRLEFRDMGRFSGSCTLTCHGVPHVRTEYSR
jgi:predicted CXXCH cytochrome family protein